MNQKNLSNLKNMASSERHSADLFANDDPFVKGATRQRIKVLLPLPLAGCYDYGVPDGMDPYPGQFVKVPLGPRKVVGVVWDNDELDQEGVSQKPVND
ncbi:MAG: hypothetical protein R3261_12605, partial [Alphaproteobacteria bacterium]|nr:hypothetical protein [Alphaproteobacteria bacterium]